MKKLSYLALMALLSTNLVAFAQNAPPALPSFTLPTTTAPPSAPTQPTNNQQQQQMQMIGKIMPLFFGFISWTLPSGLVVYFLTGNIFRIGQQALIVKLEEPQSDKNNKENEKNKDKDQENEDNNEGPVNKDSRKKRKKRRRK